MNVNAKALFWGSHLFLLLLLFLWFTPFAHPFCLAIDNMAFYFLNGSLNDHLSLQYFFGILNHKREAFLNLIAAGCLSLWAIIATQDPILRRERLKHTLYFLVCFEIGFQLQNQLFHHLFDIHRASPSLTLQPTIRLSALLQNPNIKDFSNVSFPGGHAFAMIYWGAFTYLIAPKHIGKIAITLAIFFCIPRLVSGAHWLSDVVFSSALAIVWLSWTLYFLTLFNRHTFRNHLMHIFR